MTDLKLTEKERQLLHGLLAAKERALLVETRRTDSFRLHHELREELRAVGRLMERLDNAAVAEATRVMPLAR